MQTQQGLSETEVRERIALGQVNRTRTPTSRSLWQIVSGNVFTRFNALLGTLWVMVILVGSWKDALFGWVLVVNAATGMAQCVFHAMADTIPC